MPQEKTPTDTETQLVFTQNHMRMIFFIPQKHLYRGISVMRVNRGYWGNPI